MSRGDKWFMQQYKYGMNRNWYEKTFNTQEIKPKVQNNELVFKTYKQKENEILFWAIVP